MILLTDRRLLTTKAFRDAVMSGEAESIPRLPHPSVLQDPAQAKAWMAKFSKDEERMICHVVENVCCLC